MECFQLLNLQMFTEFLKANQKFEFECECTKDYSYYLLKIEIVTKESNNQAMLLFSRTHFTLTVRIFINTEKLTEAYYNLEEEEKIPASYNIHNPILDDEHMQSLIERHWVDILKNLKEYNNLNDDYFAIAKLFKKLRGHATGEKFGL